MAPIVVAAPAGGDCSYGECRVGFSPSGVRARSQVFECAKHRPVIMRRGPIYKYHRRFAPVTESALFVEPLAPPLVVLFGFPHLTADSVPNRDCGEEDEGDDAERDLLGDGGGLVGRVGHARANLGALAEACVFVDRGWQHGVWFPHSAPGLVAATSRRTRPRAGIT